MKSILLPLAFFAALALAAPSEIWNGTADTDWHNADDTKFTIATAEQLAGLAKLVNEGDDFSGDTIVLSADIQLNDTLGWATWDENTSKTKWTPIGAYEKPFNGVFDGSGHKISGLYISTTSGHQGLFGYDSAEVIRDVGVIAGYVKGSGATGFLAGENKGIISNCYATGNVEGTGYTGGLVGENYDGSISGSYAIGNVSGTGNAVGGLVGENLSSTISSSYASGNVSGSDYVGGLVGENFGTITNSYASGDVSGGSRIGGLAGYSGNAISNSYAAGVVASSTGEDVGGLVGYHSGAVSGSYYDSDVSGQSDTGKGTPKTTAQMQSQELADTLNFRASAERGNAWIHSNGKYPTLSDEIAPELDIAGYFASGEGTLSNPYIVTAKAHLENLAILTNAGHSFQNEYISLGSDIELNNTADWENWDEETEGLFQWTPIGTFVKKFKGTFDGAGHTISGLYINTDSNYQGLFGVTDREALIKNVGVIEGYVKSSAGVGFLAGINLGTISNSYAIGNVNGNAAGGLVGYNLIGTINNSYAMGNVNGDNGAGGLVGLNEGTISKSYAAGTVGIAGIASENEYIGGLVGVNYEGNEEDIIAIISSYYDRTVSGLNDEGKGTPKSTAEMRQQATFEDWDFDDIWFIDEGNDYPKLLQFKEQPSSSSSSDEQSSSSGETPAIASGTHSGSFDLQARDGMLWIATGSLPRATTRGNDVNVQIYALNGAKVRSFSFASDRVYSISLKDLPKGLYIVRAGFGSQGNGVVRKVMVK